MKNVVKGLPTTPYMVKVRRKGVSFVMVDPDLERALMRTDLRFHDVIHSLVVIKSVENVNKTRGCHK